MELAKKIDLAETIHDLINANISGIWQGYEAVPFILYDSKFRVAVGDGWPECYRRERGNIWVAEGTDPNLMANTVTKYHGKVVAIWNTENWSDTCPDAIDATASIAHEMFHAYQNVSFTAPEANEMLLPQYPHSPLSVSLVIEENKNFVNLYENLDSAEKIISILREIAEQRACREKEIGKVFLEYDNGIESWEGTSAYAEIQMHSKLEGITPAKAALSYMPMISGANDGLLHMYRHRCYTTGVVLCLAADIVCPDWKSEWIKSGVSLFDWMKEQLSIEVLGEADCPVLGEAEGIIKAFNAEKEKKIAEFKSQPLTVMEGDIRLLTFDPMNLTCLDGECLHKHGKIRCGNEERLLTQPFLAEYGDNVLDIKRIWVA